MPCLGQQKPKRILTSSPLRQVIFMRYFSTASLRAMDSRLAGMQRMAMIMMVSVMRHTESSVKFWFITNFLSPAFKVRALCWCRLAHLSRLSRIVQSFLPHLAAQYGFQYELVTYQWPHWLRSQTEKQRTIWG